MLSKADKDALAAQMDQCRDEQEAFAARMGGGLQAWDRFIAWRTAVALEEQAAALWSEDDDDEPSKPPWER